MFFDNLSKNMKGIASMANELALSAKEISSSVQDQAAVSAQQSASVTEISSTVEELSASSNQVAENADSVARISSDSLHDSERGMKAIGSLKLKMDEISEDNQGGMKEIVALGRKSNEIGKVMEIINNIADQTKLIAFNAAIEASSAGEAGKAIWCSCSRNSPIGRQCYGFYRRYSEQNRRDSTSYQSFSN